MSDDALSSAGCERRCASITGRCSGRMGRLLFALLGSSCSGLSRSAGTSGTSVETDGSGTVVVVVVGGSVIVGGGLRSVVSGGEVVAGEGELVVGDASTVVGGAVGRATVDDDVSSSPLHAMRSAKLSPHASRSRAGRTTERAVTMSWVLPVPPTGPARPSCPPPERAQGGIRLGAGDARTDRTPNRGALTRAMRRMRYWG